MLSSGTEYLYIPLETYLKKSIQSPGLSQSPTKPSPSPGFKAKPSQARTSPVPNGDAFRKVRVEPVIQFKWSTILRHRGEDCRICCAMAPMNIAVPPPISSFLNQYVFVYFCLRDSPKCLLIYLFAVSVLPDPIPWLRIQLFFGCPRFLYNFLHRSSGLAPLLVLSINIRPPWLSSSRT